MAQIQQIDTDFASLRKAMRDLGTNEDLIISIFKNRNNGQRYMMK